MLASVLPEKLPLSDPLAGVNEAINALTFMTDELGPVITLINLAFNNKDFVFALSANPSQFSTFSTHEHPEIRLKHQNGEVSDSISDTNLLKFPNHHALVRIH